MNEQVNGIFLLFFFLPNLSILLRLIKDKLKLAVDYNARIDYLESRDASIPDKIINSIYPTLADLYIKSKNNIKAIEGHSNTSPYY